MPIAIWKEQYRLGSPAIDNQHQHLFRLVNELHDAMTRGRGREVLDSTLDRLIRYTRTHFTDEEAAMQKGGYPGLAAHKAEHEALTKQVLDLQSSYRAGHVMISIQVMQFLTRWLDHHILETDRQYAPYVVKH